MTLDASEWGNRGFEGRVFLTKDEWQILGKAKPVRYAKLIYEREHGKGPHACIWRASDCGGSGKVQIAHRIPFVRGMAHYGLTPDYLNRVMNLVAAHATICNKAAELPDTEIVLEVREAAAMSREPIPRYLPGMPYEFGSTSQS